MEPDYTPEQIEKINAFEKQIDKDYERAIFAMSEFIDKYHNTICGMTYQNGRKFYLHFDGSEVRKMALACQP